MNSLQAWIFASDMAKIQQKSIHIRQKSSYVWRKLVYNGRSFLEPSQTSKMELFAKRVNGFQPLTIFAKSSILDIW